MKTANSAPDESARTDSTCHSNESAGTDSKKISDDTAGDRDGSRDAISSLSDENLLKRINSLNARERRTMLAVLLHLGELDLRRLYLGLGYGSLFDFCVRRLGYSEPTAARRVRACRCVREHPEVLDMLREGKLSLCSVSRIAVILTAENKESVLEAARGRSTREIERLVSMYRPKLAVGDRVRPVYVKTRLEVTDGEVSGVPDRSGNDVSEMKAESGRKFTVSADGKISAGLFFDSSAVDGDRPVKGDPGRKVEVLEERYRLEFAVDAEFMEKLERVKSLLSARHPEGLGFERLFGLLMDGYIERHSPEAKRERRARRAERKNRMASAGRGGKDSGKKAASAGRGGKDSVNRAASAGAGDETGRRKRTASSGSRRPAAARHIPRAVRDEVYARDRGRCTFVGPGGRRCGSRWNLEIDHIVPFALGGGHESSNLRLLCARHNRMEGERAFGRAHMGRFLPGD